jgi:hypothetical protein
MRELDLVDGRAGCETNEKKGEQTKRHQANDDLISHEAKKSSENRRMLPIIMYSRQASTSDLHNALAWRG